MGRPIYATPHLTQTTPLCELQTRNAVWEIIHAVGNIPIYISNVLTIRCSSLAMTDRPTGLDWAAWIGLACFPLPPAFDHRSLNGSTETLRTGIGRRNTSVCPWRHETISSDVSMKHAHDVLICNKETAARQQYYKRKHSGRWSRRWPCRVVDAMSAH